VITQLELALELGAVRDDDGCQANPRDWERCLWLEEILVKMPLSAFVFTEHDCVIPIDEGIYSALGSDPHQWQDFIWYGEDEWELGDSDTGSTISPRVDGVEFAFILGELNLKQPMSESKLRRLFDGGRQKH
jgi:hypothetical protein